MSYFKRHLFNVDVDKMPSVVVDMQISDDDCFESDMCGYFIIIIIIIVIIVIVFFCCCFCCDGRPIKQTNEQKNANPVDTGRLINAGKK